MADCWYEWKQSPSDPKIKQPYYIYHRFHAPLFFAAIYYSWRGFFGIQPVISDIKNYLLSPAIRLEVNHPKRLAIMRIISRVDLIY
jgi:hypothetical protein